MESSIAVFLTWHFACEQLSIQNVKREEGGTGSNGVLGLRGGVEDSGVRSSKLGRGGGRGVQEVGSGARGVRPGLWDGGPDSTRGGMRVGRGWEGER